MQHEVQSPVVRKPSSEKTQSVEVDLRPSTERNVVDMARAEAWDPRVAWASERTLLSWVRTGIAIMAFGFVLARFGLVQRSLGMMGVDADSTTSWIAGGGMVLLGAVVSVAGTIRYVDHQQALRRGEQPVPSLLLPVSMGIGAAVAGVALVALLLLEST